MRGIGDGNNGIGGTSREGLPIGVQVRAAPSREDEALAVAKVPEWLSGCVVCLYSCPGSKVGNASYTIRDHVDGTTHFGVRPGVLPADGTEVTVRIELLDERG